MDELICELTFLELKDTSGHQAIELRSDHHPTNSKNRKFMTK